MSRALLVLHNETIRQKAIRWLSKAPKDTRVEFKAPKRTLPQNDKMWAALTDVSAQIAHHGRKLSPDQWKLMFMDELEQESDLVLSLDGQRYINIGRRSSDLSIAEMTDLIEIIYAWGIFHGVIFKDDQ